MNWTKNPLIIFWLDKRNFGRAYPLGSVLSPPTPGETEQHHICRKSYYLSWTHRTVMNIWSGAKVWESITVLRMRCNIPPCCLYLNRLFENHSTGKTDLRRSTMGMASSWVLRDLRVESTPWKQTAWPHCLMRWCLESWKKDLVGDFAWNLEF